MRPHPYHEDLGLDPDADKTPDLRPGNDDVPRAATPRTSEHPSERGSSMSTVTECQHCTVPSDGDTCTFCQKYVPPADNSPLDLPAPPAGASSVDGWYSSNDDGVLVRSLEWSRHDTEKASIGVDGWQDANGVVTRGISVYGLSEGDSLTANEAVKVAIALLKAADDLGQMDNPGPQRPPAVDDSRNW